VIKLLLSSRKGGWVVTLISTSNDVDENSHVNPIDT